MSSDTVEFASSGEFHGGRAAPVDHAARRAGRPVAPAVTVPATLASGSGHWSDNADPGRRQLSSNAVGAVSLLRTKAAVKTSLFRQTAAATGHVGYQISVAVDEFRQVVPVFMGIVATRAIDIDGGVGIHPAARHPIHHRT